MNLKKMLLLAVLLSLAFTLAPTSTVVSQAPAPPTLAVAPPVPIPDDYVAPETETMAPSVVTAQSTGLKAVAIVGTDTPDFQPYIENAVAVLRDHGVQVSTFYSAVDEFNWNDVVTAATGASYLIYAGHGVGSGDHPTELGTFYLGPNNGHIIRPETVRQDLANHMADDAVVIFNHACYTAGSPGYITREEARRRVALYAEPFVNIGFRGYYANNYDNSVTQIVRELLEARETGATLGEVFKSVFPNDPARFHDLDYPAEGYDLWLNNEKDAWNYAFVGQPTYTFDDPELGGLPPALAYTYNQATDALLPTTHTVTPVNAGNGDPLTWSVTTDSSWLELSTGSGVTPDAFTVTPNTSVIDTLPLGRHTGVVTVTVTDPPETEAATQPIPVTLDVVVPRLGGLPDALEFTYFISDTLLLPQKYDLTPENVGSADALTWELDAANAWLNLSRTTGTTPDAFTVTPASFSTTDTITYTGMITVSVTAPAGTVDAVQTLPARLRVLQGRAHRVHLPLVMRSN